MFVAIFLLLNEVLELSLIPVAVEDLFHFPLLFFIDEYRQRVFFQFVVWYQIFQGNGQFDYIKDRIKLSYQIWQFQFVGHRSDLLFYSEWAQSSVRELLRGLDSLNVQYVQEYFISRFEDRGQDYLQLFWSSLSKRKMAPSSWCRIITLSCQAAFLGNLSDIGHKSIL